MTSRPYPLLIAAAVLLGLSFAACCLDGTARRAKADSANKVSHNVPGEFQKAFLVAWEAQRKDPHPPSSKSLDNYAVEIIRENSVYQVWLHPRPMETPLPGGGSAVRPKARGYAYKVDARSFKIIASWAIL
jgi:hypothetical protein